MFLPNTSALYTEQLYKRLKKRHLCGYQGRLWSPDAVAVMSVQQEPEALAESIHVMLMLTSKRRSDFLRVWRKRWISLRYHSKNSSPILQIDSRHPVLSSHLQLNLNHESSVELIDSSGPQDLANAKTLQLLLNPLSEPLIFKHSSETEMKDWMAAFRLTVALGETGSICSDTDSSTWNDSQTAASPVSSSSPNNPFSIAENHASHFIRIKRCPAAEKFNLELDQEYEMHVSPQDLTIQSKDVKAPLLQWPLHHIKKVWMDTAEQPEGEAADGVCIETTKHHISGEGLLIIRLNAPSDFCQQMRTLTSGPANLKKILADQQERLSIRSKSSHKRHPMSERPMRKRPLSFMGQHNRLSTELVSPVKEKHGHVFSREQSIRSTKALRKFQHMDSRDSEYSSTEGGASESNQLKFPVAAPDSDPFNARISDVRSKRSLESQDDEFLPRSTKASWRQTCHSS